MMTTIDNMIWNLTHRLGINDIFDILIMSVIIYEVLILMRRTRRSALLKGVFFLLVISLASSLLGLTGLNWLMNAILNNGAVVLLILFQPEIRKTLERMGRSNLLSRHTRAGAAEDERERIISEIIQTMLDLSHRRVGALIVFERMTGLQDVIDTGTDIDAEISAPLLENIFEPNTPLHDGAVVIRGDRIQAAACILPLTEASGVSRELGTRHRAGIGLSESTDATVFIVSEETGTMSVAQGGQLLRPMHEDSLREILENIYSHRQLRFTSFLLPLKRDTKEEEE
jgi:diadenylate cyclase